jgi:hypothetical protein
MGNAGGLSFFEHNNKFFTDIIYRIDKIYFLLSGRKGKEKIKKSC